jgi:hypothetical protein
VKNSRRSGRDFFVGGGGGKKKAHDFATRFPGFARSSTWYGQCEREGVMIVRSSGLRQGPRDLHFLN